MSIFLHSSPFLAENKKTVRMRDRAVSVESDVQVESSSSAFRQSCCRTFSGALFDLFPCPFVTPGWLVFWDKNRDGLTRHFPFIFTFECFRTRTGNTVPFSVHSAFFLVYTSENNTQFFSDCAHKCCC